MTAYNAGDVVAVEFPFADLQTLKRRPGLVLVGGGNDLLVARVTTHPPRDASDVALVHWAAASQPRASTIRLVKLATIDHRLVHHKIGHLHPEDVRLIVQVWEYLSASVAAELQK